MRTSGIGREPLRVTLVNGRTVTLRRYHAHAWDEPFLHELSHKGERGVLVPHAEEEIRSAVGKAEDLVPEAMRRREPPDLPEVSQPQVLRHFLHLSQMTLGTDVNIDLGLGTCTMKYSPKVHEVLCRSPQIAEVHPLQDPGTIQGLLEILYKVSSFLKEVSGLDEVSLQPGSGSQAVFTAVSIIRAYHESRGEGDRRSEIITTMFSHPCDAACPSTAGYEVITLMPDESGYPDLDSLKAALSERTAGLLITNPEDTGIYNPRIDEYVRLVHEAGGLCFYDQANANAIMGKARAKEAGFDMCHFNLHKTFSAPHGSLGPACGALAVRKELARFLPVPVVSFDGENYYLDYDRPDSIGRIKAFLGNVTVALRAYAYVMSLGADGLRTVAETAVINNNYLEKLLMAIPGVVKPYAEGKVRLDQIRYSWEKLKEDTGVGTSDVERRMTDFGLGSYWTSHYPWIVPEPFTPEPCETYSRDDIEYWAAVMARIAAEAREDPESVKSSPHCGPIGRIDESVMLDASRCVYTYKQYKARKAAREAAADRSDGGPGGGGSRHHTVSEDADGAGTIR